jgi:hypothetical protein
MTLREILLSCGNPHNPLLHIRCSPQIPTPEQYAKLKAAEQLQLLDSPQWITNGKANLEFALPRQAISLLELTW